MLLEVVIFIWLLLLIIVSFHFTFVNALKSIELSIRSSYAKKYFSLLFPLLRYMGSFRGFLKQGEVTSEIGVGTDQRE